jgi:outer membrane protein TolC
MIFRGVLIAAALLAALGRPSESAQAQTMRLTLAEAVAYAQDHSPRAKTNRLEWAQARSNDDAFAARYRPMVELTGSVPGLNRSINEITQDDGSVAYVPQNRLSSRTSLRVTQRLPWTNTRLTVATRLNRLDLFGDRDLTRWNAAPVAVSLTQPLFQYNAAQWNRRLQPLRHEASRRRYRAGRAQVAATVASAFFDAYLARLAREHTAYTAAVNDTIHALAEKRYELGAITEVDLLRSEQQRLQAHDALAQARLTAERRADALKQVLGLDAGATLRLTPPAAPPAEPVDPDTAVARARRRAPAFAQQTLKVVQAERNLARVEGRNGISLNLNAGYGLNQQAEALGGAYRRPLNQQRLNVSFSVPLVQWGRGEAEVAAAEAALDRARIDARRQRRTQRREVRFAARRVNRLREQVALAARADTVARRRYAVARTQHRLGEIAVRTLFEAQQARDQARTRYYRRLRAFWTAYYRLRRLSLYDPVTGRPLAE